jgi:hypothetical protein
MTHPTPSIDLQLRVTDGGAVLVSLAQRRRAWLESVGQRAAGEGVPALEAIGTTLDAQLADVEQHTAALRQAFEEFGPWCNDRIGGALAAGQFGDAERAAFARVTQVRDDDYAAAGRALVAGLGERAETERATLRARLERTFEEAGLEISTHDLGCDLVALGTMGGLLTCPKTLGAGCALGAAGMITLAAFC